MKSIFLAIALSVILCPAHPQSFPVGHLTKSFTDPARNNRVIETEIYYPAIQAGNNVPVAQGSFPVLAFGHGFVMTYTAYQNLWDSLVPLGYIMLLPKTEGGLSPSHNEFGLDLAFLPVQMSAETNDPQSPFYQRVAPASALMGHSMGGGAAILAAQNNSQATAVVTFAAANTSPSAITAAAGVSMPSLIFAGENDCVTPPSAHQIPIYNALGAACKAYASVLGGGHCYFANYNLACAIGEASCSPSPTINREQQHAAVLSLLKPFLAAILKQEAGAWDGFTDSLLFSPRIDGQLNCLPSVTTGSESTVAGLDLRMDYMNSAILFRFGCPAPARYSVSLFNVRGHEIHRKNLDCPFGIISDSIPMEGLAVGFYLITVKGDHTLLSKKLVWNPK